VHFWCFSDSSGFESGCGALATPPASGQRAAALASRTPLKRTGKLQEPTGLLLFLVSDSSSFVTGQVIAEDGGWTIW
jgi:NAD(P)-dependent dehydrogenase (short-subunit alcohol dehydrogenase family)